MTPDGASSVCGITTVRLNPLGKARVMARIVRLALVIVLPLLWVVVLGSLLVRPATAGTSGVCDPDGIQPDGAVSQPQAISTGDPRRAVIGYAIV